jgi:predicted RNA-binding protein with RPS1 domain
MIEDKIKYSTAFTGALLARETEVLISFIINIEDFLQKKETVDYTVIPVNSENQKNLKSEIEKTPTCAK